MRLEISRSKRRSFVTDTTHKSLTTDTFHIRHVSPLPAHVKSSHRRLRIRESRRNRTARPQTVAWKSRTPPLVRSNAVSASPERAPPPISAVAITGRRLDSFCGARTRADDELHPPR